MAAAAASRRLTSAGDCSGGPWRVGKPGRAVLAAALAMLAVLTAGAAVAAPAQAQPGPAYAATPPTLGALYRDGPDDRWLLGGAWLYRADPTDAGAAARLVAQRREH